MSSNGEENNRQTSQKNKNLSGNWRKISDAISYKLKHNNERQRKFAKISKFEGYKYSRWKSSAIDHIDI